MDWSARFLTAIVPGSLALYCAIVGDAHAQAVQQLIPTGTVKLSGTVVAAGIGYRWGRGTLDYNNEGFEFCIRGLSVGDLGAAHLSAQGVIYNLQSLDDFAGRYTAVSASVAIARGGGGGFLQNKRGVVMELNLRETGLRLNVAATGVRITMAGAEGCPKRNTSPD